MAGTRAGALKAWDKRGRKGPHAGVTQAQRAANRIIAKRSAGLSASAIKRKYVLAKGEAIPTPPRQVDSATAYARRILAANKRMRKRHSVESLAADIRAGKPFGSTIGRMW